MKPIDEVRKFAEAAWCKNCKEKINSGPEGRKVVFTCKHLGDLVVFEEPCHRIDYFQCPYNKRFC